MSYAVVVALAEAAVAALNNASLSLPLTAVWSSYPCSKSRTSPRSRW